MYTMTTVLRAKDYQKIFQISRATAFRWLAIDKELYGVGCITVSILVRNGVITLEDINVNKNGLKNAQ